MILPFMSNPAQQSNSVMFELLFDLIPFAIYVVDINTYEVVYLNRSMRERIVAEPGQQKCYKVIYGEETPCFFCKNRELLDDNQQPKNTTLVSDHFNPVNDLWYQLQEKSLFWPDGKIVKYSIAVEVSKLKETQNHLAEAHAQLALKTRALEKLSQEKNEFLGIAAHDLKNPLSVILGIAEFIAEEAETFTTSEIQEQARLIEKSARHMFQLIKNLLDINAIETGHFNYKIESVNIAHMLERFVKIYTGRAQAKALTLRTEIGTDRYWVFADNTILYQVLDNLISNAIKYSPPGKTVTLRLYLQQDQICLEVQDEGNGLTLEDQKRLFCKFTQLSAKPTGGEHSTGLGLFIAKKLIQLIHGTIRCESQPGHGATFIVTLPPA